MRIIAVLHDLCLALVVGGLGAVFVAAFVLFDVAPNREIAGQVGNALFNLLGPSTLIVALLLLGARLYLNSGKSRSKSRRVVTWLSAVNVPIAAAVALWLTPAMDVIWRSAPHAADGSGLEGADRGRFMVLHGAGSACYLAIWITGCIILVTRAAHRARR